MNALILQKREASRKLEQSIKNAKRSLLELDVAQAKWEIAHGKGRTYVSATELMKDITKRLK